jgi:hypothetical protein
MTKSAQILELLTQGKSRTDIMDTVKCSSSYYRRICNFYRESQAMKSEYYVEPLAFGTRTQSG